MRVDRKILSGSALGFFLALSLCCLSGCQRHAAPSSVASSPASAPMPSQVATAPAAGASVVAAPVMRGVYTWGVAVETLSPCNTDKTYWLEGSEALLAPLQELAIKKADAADEAYQPIYVEVQAIYMGHATDGFAVDYDGVMQLQSVQKASNVVPADCKLLDVPPVAAVADASGP